MNLRRLALFLTASLATYAFVVRPRLLRWGATDAEFDSPYPGADLIPGGTRSATMAVTIDAPPADVWPWLVQMGYGRAGWYSWDYLDNFGRRCADRIHPEWQNVNVGDMLAGPDVSEMEKSSWQVAAIEPERFLGLRASFDLRRGRRFDPAKDHPQYFTDSIWGFLLKPLADNKTRLIVSGYWRLEPKWLQPFASFAALEWTHWIMQTRQFANIKRRAEKAGQERPSPAVTVKGTEGPGKIAVIGAGIAGLCAAVYAQKSGYEVELFEQHEVPGGLAASWKRGEYTFENSLVWLLGSKPGGILHDRWREVFDIDALTFVNPDEYIRVETESGESLRIYRDADRMEAALVEQAPEDADEIHRLASMVRRLANGDLPELGEDLPHALLRFLRAIPVLPQLRWLSGLTAGQYSSRFKNRLLKRVFADDESSNFIALAVVFALAWMNSRNAGYPIGGSRAVTQPILAEFERLGGRLRCNAFVEKILVENNTATGVQLRGGETTAADWVISAADGYSTVYDLLEGKYTDSAIDELYSAGETFASYVLVCLGVARDLSQHGSTVLWVPANSIPVDPQTSVSQFTVRFFHEDPTFAPPGKTAVTCGLPTRNFAYWLDLQQQDPAKYQAEKDRVAQAVISSLETRIPDLRAAIEVIDIATPASVIHFTRNWKGSSEGWLPTPGSGLSLPNTLPRLRKFYMAGQWVAPGGGFPSGLMTARRAVRDICKYDGVAFLKEQKAHTHA